MKFEFNSDGFDGLLDDLKTFELNCPECNHSIEVLLLFSSIHHKKIRLNKRKLKKPKLSSNVPKMKYCNNSFTT